MSCHVEWRRWPCSQDLRRRCQSSGLQAHDGNGHQPLDSPGSFFPLHNIYSCLLLLAVSAHSVLVCPLPSRLALLQLRYLIGSTSHMLISLAGGCPHTPPESSPEHAVLVCNMGRLSIFQIFKLYLFNISLSNMKSCTLL